MDEAFYVTGNHNGGRSRLVVRWLSHVALGRKGRMPSFWGDEAAPHRHLGLGRGGESQVKTYSDRAAREEMLWREATTSSSRN